MRQIPQDGALAHGDACGSLDTKLGQEVFMVAAVSGTTDVIMWGFAPIIVGGHGCSCPEGYSIKVAHESG